MGFIIKKSKKMELKENINKDLIDNNCNIVIPKDKRQIVESWSRVVGYYRPIQNWNRGKVEEFKDRIEFDEKLSLDSQFALLNTPSINPIKK